MAEVTCQTCMGLGHCPNCGGSGSITVEDECRIRNCRQEAVYHYHNGVTNFKGDYCPEHLAGLRPDMSVSDWIERGFADRIKQKEAPKNVT